MTSNHIGTSTLTNLTASELLLGLATGFGMGPSGLVERPHFFSGIAARPEVAAAGILAVADVASTTYLDLSALAMKDPVVTASGDRLRFESFSGCNGVHARFDLLPDGIASGDISFGTTNVDVNMPLRGALAALPRHELMHLQVGADSLRVSTPGEFHEERKVELPERWVRGFAEIPTLLAAMKPIAEASGPHAMSFLAGLPRGAPGPAVGIAAGPRGLRVTAAGTSGAATLAGTARVASLRRVMRHVRRLTVWAHDSGASAWVADVDGGRITLVVSPQPYRGFSGEGQLLAQLSAADTSGPALRLLEHLAWEPRIDPAALELETAMTGAEVRAAIAVLAASGKVGYDLSEGAYFHREIPYDAGAIERDHPRLAKARALVAAGAVEISDGAFRVGDLGHQHWVTLVGPDEATCTCRWHARYQGGRGPCAHILAVRLATRR